MVFFSTFGLGERDWSLQKGRGCPTDLPGSSAAELSIFATGQTTRRTWLERCLEDWYRQTGM
jgi:hypothetical protein